jgi:putative Holliday junction resolvase
MKTYLGVDWGEKRIGLAIADDEISLATPFKTVSNLEELLAVIQEEMVDGIILGRPIKMRGEQDGINPDFSKFAEELKNKANLEIIMIDERLTSQEADALPGGNLKASRDEVAAMIILQNFLDRLDGNIDKDIK